MNKHRPPATVTEPRGFSTPLYTPQARPHGSRDGMNSKGTGTDHYPYATWPAYPAGKAPTGLRAEITGGSKEGPLLLISGRDGWAL